MLFKRQNALRAMMLAVAVAAPFQAAGQAFAREDAELVDRVIAVVGDSVVLLSQVQTDLQQMALQGRPLPQDPTQLQALFDASLQDRVDRLLVLQAAAKDTLISVDEQEIEASVQEEIDRRTQAFGGPAQFQQALQTEGLTTASYRELLGQQIRQGQIYQAYMQRRLRNASPIVVDEAEVRRTFEEARSQIGQRPRLLSFSQVVIAPTPSEDADSAALREARAVRDSIEAGAEFEVMAERYSDDPGSAPQGGDLDWFRRGTMVREFEDVAFGLRDGQVSDPVETEFGYHIIKVERSRPGERRGRHILFSPDLTETDAAAARELAESVAAQARSGVAMETLSEQYADPEAPDTLTVTYDQLGQLPPGYDQLANAGVGDVVGPVEYQAARGQLRIAVMKVREIQEAGEYRFEEVRAQIEERLIQQKQAERVVAELRSRTYVDMRMQ